jgi:hypothetical protein
MLKIPQGLKSAAELIWILTDVLPSPLSFAVNVPLTPDDWTDSTLTVPYRLVVLRPGVANIIAVDVEATVVIVDVVHEARVMIRKSRTDFRFL